MGTYLIAIFIILALMSGWIGVQHLSRTFARRHPEWGPPREEGAGCGLFCFCRNRETCPKSKLKNLKPGHPDQKL